MMTIYLSFPKQYQRKPGDYMRNEVGDWFLVGTNHPFIKVDAPPAFRNAVAVATARYGLHKVCKELAEPSSDVRASIEAMANGKMPTWRSGDHVRITAAKKNDPDFGIIELESDGYY